MIQKKKVIRKQQEQIDNQQNEMNKKADQLKALNKRADDLTSENHNIKTAMNDLEQYGRRNSLRFNNMKMDPKLEERELTKQMVIFINSKVLKPDQSKISEANIDRCHQVGPKSKPKQILIKFSSYHTIWHVFRSKGNMNNFRDHVFVCEDLTTDNYKLVKSLNDPPKKEENPQFLDN